MFRRSLCGVPHNVRPDQKVEPVRGCVCELVHRPRFGWLRLLSCSTIRIGFLCGFCARVDVSVRDVVRIGVADLQFPLV